MDIRLNAATFRSTFLFSRLIFLLLSACFSLQAFSWENNNSTLYIDPNLIKPNIFLPPPPPADSLETNREIILIKNIMSNISRDQKMLAKSDALTKNVSFFADVILNFDIDKLPITKAVFESIRYNENYEVKVFKKYFSRKRPTQIDDKIKPCVGADAEDLFESYPSGHTTMAYSMGIILANLMPEKANQIMERSRKYANNRVFCGAHFPSDVVAGQVLGSLVALSMLENSLFKIRLEESKQELIRFGFTVN